MCHIPSPFISIIGTEFIVRMGHQSLQWIQEDGRHVFAECEPFIVQYRSEQVNEGADARMLEDLEYLPDEVLFGIVQVESYPIVMGKSNDKEF